MNWISIKLNSLPEEDFEKEMFKQACKMIQDHSGEYLDINKE